MRMEASDNFIASLDDTGSIIIWSLEAALERKEAQLTRLQLPVPGRRSNEVGVGANFVVSHLLNRREILVFDFL